MTKLGWHSLGTTFDCECGKTHSLPIEACHVGEDAVETLADFAADRCGPRALVLADPDTFAVGADGVIAQLERRGKSVASLVLEGDELDGTMEVAEKVRGESESADFIVAVGSGTLSDLAKYAGSALNKPVILFPTAASMNGYTSAIVALEVRGLKRTLPCKPATAVFGDPAVAATAPQRMTAAGIADFLSKCSSSTDWRAAKSLRDVYFCERPREFFEGSQDRILESAEAAGRGDVEAVGVVLEALLLSGCSMVVAGSSAPASGGEHLISHYLDMKSALYGSPHDLHGAQVGVGTVHCLGLWKKIFALEPKDVDVEALLERRPSEDGIREAIDDDWGPVASEVQAQWDEKSLDRDAMRRELERFVEVLPVLREECAKDYLDPEIVSEAIGKAGGPVRPEELTAPLEEYHKALRSARYIRNRFTSLDLAAELGMA